MLAEPRRTSCEPIITQLFVTCAVVIITELNTTTWADAMVTRRVREIRIRAHGTTVFHRLSPRGLAANDPTPRREA